MSQGIHLHQLPFTTSIKKMPLGIYLSRRYSEVGVLIITPTGGSRLTSPVLSLTHMVSSRHSSFFRERWLSFVFLVCYLSFFSHFYWLFSVKKQSWRQIIYLFYFFLHFDPVIDSRTD